MILLLFRELGNLIIELGLSFYRCHCAALSVAQKSTKTICASEVESIPLTLLYVYPIVLSLRPIDPYLTTPLKTLRCWPLVARGKGNFGSQYLPPQMLVALDRTFPQTVRWWRPTINLAESFVVHPAFHRLRLDFILHLLRPSVFPSPPEHIYFFW